jgi:hypothetical protein
MNNIIDRLIADLRWRQGPQAGPHRLTRREAESWGAQTIGWPVKFFSGCAFQLMALGLCSLLADINNALSLLFLIPLFLGTPLSFWLFGYVQRAADVAAYRRKLLKNERFTLVEYSHLLTRHIAMAQRDPALGGQREVERLTNLRGQLLELIDSGVGLAGGPQATTLGEEAQLAESLLETYSVAKDDGLKDLDARLPEELRSRLADLDRGAQQQQPPRQRQSQ